MTLFRDNIVALASSLAVCTVVAFPAAHTVARAAQQADDARAAQLNERYLSLLRRNPRRGTAFDKVVAFHTKRQTLDRFAESLATSAEAAPGDGSSVMLLGMIEAHRGNHAAAADAFRRAEQHRPDDAVASWYLGEELLRIGSPADAAAALERAITRKPPRADLLEIHQQLAAVHQQTGNAAAAIEILNRLEAEFPGDERVMEQVAAALVDGGQHEAALQRFEQLARSSADRSKRSEFAVRAAEQLLELGREAEAVRRLSEQLVLLKPGSWQHTEIRDRIEAALLKSGSYAAVADYYRQHLTRQPDDLDAMIRLGRVLSFDGQTEQARRWYEQAVSLAPSDVKVRRALIEELLRQPDIPAAVAQYEQLARLDPDNFEHAEQYGRLLLRDSSQDDAARRAKAKSVWQSLVTSHAGDADVVARVAGLFRSAGMADEALTLLRQAIALAPAEPQYREDLGDLLNSLNRRDEALAAWRGIAADERNTPENLVRTAEILRRHGCVKESLQAMSAAAAADLELADRLRFSQWLREAERWDEALQQLDSAERVVSSDDERERLETERIRTLQAAGRLTHATERLQEGLARGEGDSPRKWLTLAQYHEAAGNLGAALPAVSRALEKNAESAAAWKLAARMFENTGRLADAVEASRRLAAADRRYRSEALRKVADLERRLGRLDSARAAARELLDAAPGNIENQRFFADLSFQLGDDEAGLEALRQAVRLNPGNSDALLRLGRALADRFATTEAVDVYWKALEQSTAFDGRCEIVRDLAELALRQNQFEQLLARLQRGDPGGDEAADSALLTAVAFETAGDFSRAEQTLQQLLTRDDHDVRVLEQLANLAERAQHFTEAAAYQQRIVDLSPTPEAKSRLATLLHSAGSIGDVDAALLKLPDEHAGSVAHLLQTVDQFVDAENLLAARSLVERLLARHPADTGVLLRMAFVEWKQGDHAAAAELLDRIIATPVADESPQSSDEGSGPFVIEQGRAVIDEVVRILKRNPGMNPTTPRHAGALQAMSSVRVGAIAARTLAGQGTGSEAFLDRLESAARAGIASDSRPAWDWYFALDALHTAGRGTLGETHPPIELLRQRPEPETQLLYLMKVRSQAYFEEALPESRPVRGSKPAALTDDRALRLYSAWDIVRESHPEWIRGDDLVALIRELDLTGRAQEAATVMQTLTGEGAALRDLEAAAIVAARRGDPQTVAELLTRLAAFPFPSADDTLRLGEAVARLVAQLPEAGNTEQAATLALQFVTLKAIKDPQTATSPGSATSAMAAGVAIYSPDGKASRPRLPSVLSETGFTAEELSVLATAWWAASRANRKQALLDQWQSIRHAQPEHALALELAAAQWHAFNNDRQQSAIHLVRAAQLQPDAWEIRLQLARFYRDEGHFTDALALLETIDSGDGDIIRVRELLALEISLSAGVEQRARAAAETLAGMHLDPRTSQLLSTRLQLLHLDELADDLAGRLVQPVDNRGASLLATLQQYQQQQDFRMAGQVARQILRDTSAGVSSLSEDGKARTAALHWLASAGELTPMITELRQQSDRSPDDVGRLELLAEYYSAADMEDEAAAVNARLSQLAPTDLNALQQQADRFAQEGRHELACDTLAKLLRLDVSRFGNEYYRIIRTFESSGRVNELADVLVQSDLSKLSANPHAVQELIEQLLRDRNHHEAGRRLFAKAWEALPAIRQNLLSNVSDERIWELPVMLDYVRRGVIPSSPQDAVARPWEGIAGPLSFQDDGCVTGTLQRLLTALHSSSQLQSFAMEVDEALDDLPSWHGGFLISATLHATAGDTEAAQRRLGTLLGNAAVRSQIPADVAWVTACALQNKDAELRLDAIRLLQIAVENRSATPRVSAFVRSPAQPLSRLLAEDGRSADARTLILAELDTFAYPAADTRGVAGFWQTRDRLAAGQELLRLEYPFDALFLLSEITPDLIENAAQWGGQPQTLRRTSADLTTAARRSIGVPALLRYVDAVNQDERPLAFAPVVSSADVRDQRVVSSLAEALAAAGHATTSDTANLRAMLQAMAARSADDAPAAAVALVIFGRSGNDDGLTDQGLQWLSSYLSRIAAAETAHADDSLLWLAARAVWRESPPDDIHHRLADRAATAVASAQRADLLAAMLRERGELELAEGDREAAEKSWARLLEVILARDSTGTSGSPSTAVEELRSRLLNR